MKHLYVLRHAKSGHDHPDLSDFDRPLKKRGCSDARIIGSVLAEAGDNPDLIVSSPARRALDTARIVAGQTDYDPKEVQTDRRLYLADVDDVMTVLRELPDAADRVLLVGHNPGLFELALFLGADDLDGLPTAACYQIAFAVEHWNAIEPRHARWRGWDRPKNHR
ncbi:MAG: SixA phosphatase family protein [Planctomycetota bacterium]